MSYYIDRKPNGIYRLRGTHHGVPAGDRSLKTRKAEQAEAMREKAERDVFDRIVLGKKPPQKFATLAVDYQNAGRDLGPRAEEIILHLADKDLADISPADCDTIAAQVYPNAKPSTINRNIIAPISAIMNWAADANRVAYRKWPRRRERQTRTDWRRPSQIEDLLDALPSPQARALFAAYVGCGLRASEAVFLDGRDIAPDLSQLTVRGTAWDDDEGAAEKGYEGTKGYRDRTVKIPPRARELLYPVVSLEPGRALVNSYGMPWADRNALTATLTRAAKRIGVPDLSPHVLRHTWATWDYAVHKDTLALMQRGGWTKESLVLRYVHLSDDALKAEITQANWAISGQTPPPKNENLREIKHVQG
jgi:integrase